MGSGYIVTAAAQIFHFAQNISFQFDKTLVKCSQAAKNRRFGLQATGGF
jgi:hypothetical protein